MVLSVPELALLVAERFALVLATLLPIRNPAATAPILLGLTEGASAQTRAVLARRMARNMVLLRVGAMVVGSGVLDLFGMSLPLVRAGGGLIVAANAWRLLNANDTRSDRRQALAEGFTAEHARAQAVYPLTFPISWGPGSMAAAITLGLSLHDDRLSSSLARFGGGALALVVIGVIMFLVFGYVVQLLKPLGEQDRRSFCAFLPSFCCAWACKWSGTG